MSGEDSSAPSHLPQLQIWDVPIRLFHWSLVVLLGIAWWSGESGQLGWHRVTGYAILTLIIFRFGWGVFGSTTARFSSFVVGPRTVARYVRTQVFTKTKTPIAGHNPLGGWSVAFMLGLLLAQVALGFFAVDIDGLESGPFSYLIDFDTGRLAAEWHSVVFTMLQAIVALHIATILFYAVFRRDDLITPMIIGRRPWKDKLPKLQVASTVRSILVLALAAVLVWGLIGLWGRA